MSTELWGRFETALQKEGYSFESVKGITDETHIRALIEKCGFGDILEVASLVTAFKKKSAPPPSLSAQGTTKQPKRIGELAAFNGTIQVIDDECKEPFVNAKPLSHFKGGQAQVDKVCWRSDIDQKQLFARKTLYVTPTTNVLIRECQLLSSIKHDHIVSLENSYFHCGKNHIILSPWCDMQLGDVRLEVFKGMDYELSECVPIVLKIMACVVNAVAYLHNVAKIKHLDIKPANIVLRDGVSLHPYLIDFGFSQRFTASSGRKASGQTELYASPEQEMGKECRRSSDVFSLGAVFAFLLLSTNRKRSFNKVIKTAKIKKFDDMKLATVLAYELQSHPLHKELTGCVIAAVQTNFGSRPTALDLFHTIAGLALWCGVSLHCESLPIVKPCAEEEIQDMGSDDDSGDVSDLVEHLDKIYSAEKSVSFT